MFPIFCDEGMEYGVKKRIWCQNYIFMKYIVIIQNIPRENFSKMEFGVKFQEIAILNIQEKLPLCRQHFHFLYNVSIKFYLESTVYLSQVPRICKNNIFNFRIQVIPAKLQVVLPVVFVSCQEIFASLLILSSCQQTCNINWLLLCQRSIVETKDWGNWDNKLSSIKEVTSEVNKT